MELKRPWEYFFPFPVKELFEKRKERKKKGWAPLAGK